MVKRLGPQTNDISSILGEERTIFWNNKLALSWLAIPDHCSARKITCPLGRIAI